ncbi:MAG: diguanylate cyclase [Dehalococcoidia bacterium]|nr:diguanylate cyclase [Dehalococcoidia bacterium]
MAPRSPETAPRRLLRAGANITPYLAASATTVVAAQAIFPTNVPLAAGITGLAWVGVIVGRVAQRFAPVVVTEVRENPVTTLIDGESGLGNARQLEEVLHREIARSVRYGDRSALGVFDIQVGGFNPVTPGDQPPSPARYVAQTLVNSVREADTVLRLDRTRFVVLLAECPQEEGEKLVARLRTQLSTTPYGRNADGSGIYVRAWGALAEWDPAYRSPETYMRAALIKLEESRGEYEAAQVWFSGQLNPDRRLAPPHQAHKETA